MLDGYRQRLLRQGYDWGQEGEWPTISKFVNFCDPGKIEKALRSVEVSVLADVNSSDMNSVEMQIVSRSLLDPLPQGIVVVAESGVRVADSLPLILPGSCLKYHVLDTRAAVFRKLSWKTVVTAENPFFEFDGLRVRLADEARSADLVLVSDSTSRWSVLDERGGPIFPTGALRKFDYHGRPFFHAARAELSVPEGGVTVSVARGYEFEPATVRVNAVAGVREEIDLRPTRRFDSAARGWYGADLHVHMNYSGNQVCTPSHAAAMQRGEGLHLMNLVAANASTSLVYDKEAFETFAGQALPWSDGDVQAHWGVEFRNDLFGHFHVLNPSVPPSRYYTGHSRSDVPEDWPPNAVVAAECRGSGGTIGYTHPVQVDLDSTGSPEAVFQSGRSRAMDARELVADAALGLVDSVDLTGNATQSLEGTEFLYHRLLGCGLRLAAAAGTDVMLSTERASSFSNPPGWCRSYAYLGDSPLTVEAWQAALRAGRTFSTNGPWLEFDVDGARPGDTVQRPLPGPVRVNVRVAGPGVHRVDVIGADGLYMSHVIGGASEENVQVDVLVERSTWLVAVARGGIHPEVLGPKVYAHTSPVWVAVSRCSVGRAADAAWCLDWLERFEVLARASGRFETKGQWSDLVAVLNEARGFYQRIVDRGN